MHKIKVCTPCGGTQIIEKNEDGTGVLKIRHHKMTDESVTKRWVFKQFTSVRGDLSDTIVLADGTVQMTGHDPDVVAGTLYVQ